MSVQSIINPTIQPSSNPCIRPKVEWLGRQISTMGKKLYSYLAKITVLFYQTIKTHPKKSLAILTATTVTLLVYYNRKPLVTFLKSLKPDPEKQRLQQKVEDLSKQLSEKSQTLQKLLPSIAADIATISTSQKALLEESCQIKSKYAEIRDAFIKLDQDIPKDTPLKKHVDILEKKEQTLKSLEINVQKLIKDAANCKNSLNSSNPFAS